MSISWVPRSALACLRVGALVFAGGVFGCGASAPSPAAPAAEAAQSTTTEAIARRWLALSPSFGRVVGLHEYDGKIADLSAAGIEARIATLRQLQAELAARAPTSDVNDRLDASMLAQSLALELFNLTEVEAWRALPFYY